MWEVATGRHLGTYEIADTCGVAPESGRFVASDGRGRLWSIDAVKRIQREIPLHIAGHPAWDNRLIRV